MKTDVDVLEIEEIVTGIYIVTDCENWFRGGYFERSTLYRLPYTPDETRGIVSVSNLLLTEEMRKLLLDPGSPVSLSRPTSEHVKKLG